MNCRRLSLLATQISSYVNSRFLTLQSPWWYTSVLFIGGGKYLARLFISWKRSAYWIMITLKILWIYLWIYFKWSWKALLWFLPMVFTRSDHNSWLKSLQRYSPKIGSLSVSHPSYFPQSQNIPWWLPLRSQRSTGSRKTSLPSPCRPEMMHYISSALFLPGCAQCT